LPAHGITVGDVKLDLANMLARKDTVVRTVTRGVEGLFKKNKITWVRGTGRISAPDKVEVTPVAGTGGDVQTLATKRILIATGSAPIELGIAPFDGQRIISSTEALSLPAVPKRMVVVGAGAIGLEMGSVWSRLGAEVLVVEMLDRVVPGMDSAMAKLLQRSLEKQGLRFALRSTLTKVTKRADGPARRSHRPMGSVRRPATCAGRRRSTTLYAEPRRGRGRVKLDERGRIAVDEHFASSVPSIYAIGDAIPGPMLAHKAEEEGVAAVENMAGPRHVNYSAIPNVVYASGARQRRPQRGRLQATRSASAHRQLPGQRACARNGRYRGTGEGDRRRQHRPGPGNPHPRRARLGHDRRSRAGDGVLCQR
jgi:dihydrolipoamide dehydrogenase